MIDQPNYDYLKLKLNITDAKQLKEAVLGKCDKIDMKEMARDVQPFLFDPADIKKVISFEEYLRQISLK
jgi:hypothetical protein